MLRYLFRRLMYMLLVVWLTSVVSFLIIQLPAGDFVTNLATQYARSGRDIDQAKLDSLRHQFGLDRPVYVQYFHWAANVLQGDWGWSFRLRQSVVDALGDRVGLTAAITLSTLLISYIIAIPIGIY
jgi:peptide/nickel transport system permease protein